MVNATTTNSQLVQPSTAISIMICPWAGSSPTTDTVLATDRRKRSMATLKTSVNLATMLAAKVWKSDCGHKATFTPKTASKLSCSATL